MTGVILAGGRGSRMGNKDKGLVVWRGKALYQHVLSRLAPQTDKVCISANRNIMIYQQSGLPVIADSIPGFAGPLAGMLAALKYIDTEWAAFTPCDSPLLPPDLVARLWHARLAAPAVWPCTEEGDHPAMALLNAGLAGQLERFLARGGRRVKLFLEQAGGHAVSFDGSTGAFMNVNGPDNLSP
ncbi:molybdenum cofactor guanylyltransferase MobA [Erwinia tracheiphila]|uniref:Molybdenum cofactor guanylyltransferase n=2 Tax=Erwinia tracheiphila TaxID=65700 RepID=A0A345CZL2_9GAMM|nr:molybdenum cofactor guanylyltransferase MobA [Erwinia tracheiphila]AXF78879.1 molybdenum cofactor guanylyltransferase MobA [Erwinia tracheiphila]